MRGGKPTLWQFRDLRLASYAYPTGGFHLNGAVTNMPKTAHHVKTSCLCHQSRRTLRYLCPKISTFVIAFILAILSDLLRNIQCLRKLSLNQDHRHSGFLRKMTSYVN